MTQFTDFRIAKYDEVEVPLVYKVDVYFSREKVCAEGYTDQYGRWICLRYFPNEWEGILRVANLASPGTFTTTLDIWTHWARDYNEHKACQLHGKIAGYNWKDYIDSGYSRNYSFSYITPITGMPLDVHHIIKVYDPEDRLIYQDTIPGSLY